jgi:tetratricopeptide (TPR) repeat protein
VNKRLDLRLLLIEISTIVRFFGITDAFQEVEMKSERTGILADFFVAVTLLVVVGATVQAQALYSADQYLKRGISRYGTGDLEGAIADFSRAIELNSRPGKARERDYSIRSFTSGGSEKIGPEQVAVVDRFNALAYYNRGIAWFARGMLNQAVIDFDKAIRINPLFVDAYIRRGRCRQSRGDTDGAIADYNKAIGLDSRSAFAYNNRGIARRAKEDLAGAISDFSEAISINPDLAEAYVNRGAARCVLGEMAGAVADLDKAIAINPRNAMAYNNRGKARQLEGDMPAAVADYDQAIRIDPSYALAYANRGLARLLEGKVAQAESDFRRCLALKPDLKPGLEQLINEIKDATGSKH